MNEKEFFELSDIDSDKWWEIRYAQERRGEFTRDIHYLSKWPPFNYRGFNDAKLSRIVDTFKTILLTKLSNPMSYDLYDEELYDKVLAPVRTEVEEARMYKARYKTVKEATEAYIKDNSRNKYDIDDFWT